MYDKYITAAWETDQPLYFLPNFLSAVIGGFPTVLHNQIFCDFFHSSMS